MLQRLAHLCEESVEQGQYKSVDKWTHGLGIRCCSDWRPMHESSIGKAWKNYRKRPTLLPSPPQGVRLKNEATRPYTRLQIRGLVQEAIHLRYL